MGHSTAAKCGSRVVLAAAAAAAVAAHATPRCSPPCRMRVSYGVVDQVTCPNLMPRRNLHECHLLVITCAHDRDPSKHATTPARL
jgi:hypothetical protein